MPTPIEHVIVLMLENRSFDHLFAYSGIANLQGVDTSKSNPDKDGNPIAMTDTAPDRAPSDPGHEFEDVDWQIYGASGYPAPRPILMDGFASKDWPEAMQCAKPELVPALTHLAATFLVCDRWFASMPGPTWPNRFFVHAGSSGGLANSPSNLTSVGSILWSKLGFSFEHGSLFDALAGAGKSWRVYHGDDFPQVCAIDNMPSVFVASPEQFRKLDALPADLQRGDVADYTFIEPDYSILSSFRNGNSQHPAGTLSAGDKLIQTVANAVMTSEIWMKSLFVVLYDEHGGFYDQVPTPTGVVPPGDDARNADKAATAPDPPFAFDRLGVRVPAVIVSPWIKPGVSHTLYDHASIVRTVFEVFGLSGQLTDRDGRAASLGALIEPTVQTATPVPVPSAMLAPQTTTTAAAPSPRYVHSLDGFVRIAAQVHHALLSHQSAPHLAPHELHAANQAVNPDLAYLPGLPRTSSADESRAYLAHVAQLVALHRQRQRTGLAP
jgi:phospholipase C